jgi:RHS repeat-associated protein
LPALPSRSRTTLTTRRRWRNRASERRRAPGRAHFNYFRDYDPAVGGYLEADPLGIADGPAPYAYARSSPGRRTDPAALFSLDYQFNFYWVGQNLLATIPKVAELRTRLSR